MKNYYLTLLMCLFACFGLSPTQAFAGAPIEDGVYYISCTLRDGYVGLGSFHGATQYIYYVEDGLEMTDDAYWVVENTSSGYTIRNEATDNLLIFTYGRDDQYYKYMTLSSNAPTDGSQYWNIIEGSDGAVAVQSTMDPSYYWNLRKNPENLLGTYSGSNGTGQNERFVFHKKSDTPVPQGEHEWVDLGLPSGTLWATCNVGANAPEEYGNYFAWGEIKPKKSNGTWKDYSWETYKWMNSGQADWTQINKYTFADNQTEACWYDSNGTFIGDGLTVLLPEDDAATANWGSEWQTPSLAQFEELFDSENTTSTWTTKNGVNGRLVTSKKNNASIFLPAAGRLNGTESQWEGSYGFYWPNVADRTYSDRACQIYFDASSVSAVGSFDRYAGESVRPVRVRKTGEHKYVDLDLPSGTLWATCNIGASRPEQYGDYFAWGETEPKSEYSWTNYKHCINSPTNLTRYCTDPSRGAGNMIDNLTELLPEDDAATVNWGSEWHMPTKAQIEELCNTAYTTSVWTELNGVAGRLVTSISNGNSIFLPASGCVPEAGTSFSNYVGKSGFFWASTLNSLISHYGEYLEVSSNRIGSSSYYRDFGQPVRPVRDQDFRTPTDPYTAFVFPRALHVYLSDGRIEAYPLKWVTSHKEQNGQLVIETSFWTYTYDLADVDSVSEQRPDFPTFDSFKFAKQNNDQVFGTCKGEMVGDTVFVTVPAIGKRLTPTFSVVDEDAEVYVINKLQPLDFAEGVGEGVGDRLRFDKDIYYLVTKRGYSILTAEPDNKYIMHPYGRCVRVHVDWPTDRAEVPTIYINTADGQPITSKDYFKDATISIDGHDIFPSMEETPMQIKGRGNSSWGWPKKPYRLKFAEKVKPLGMTKGKSWVLLSNYQTGSLMSNAIGMKAANLMGAAAANHIVPVDLYLNGEYRGSYNFTEKVGLSNNSVDIDDETVAALLELDSYYDEPDGQKFRSTPYNLPINVKEPEFADDTTQLTLEMIQAHFNSFMSALYRGKDISPYVDIEQLARFTMVNELTLNYEFYHPKSTFCYRENFLEDTCKYIFGPVWDLDWCFGYEKNKTYFKSESTSNYWIDCPQMNAVSFIRDLRFKYAPLDDVYRQLWEEFMDNDLQELLEYCQDYYDFAKNSFNANRTKWGDNTDYAQQAQTAADWLETRANKVYEDIVNDVRPYMPEPSEPIEFSNNKLYYISCPRGELILNYNYDALEAGQSAWWTVQDYERQFAIINIEGNNYLYSPHLKMFLKTGNSLPGEWVDYLGSPIIFDADHPYNSDYIYMISTLTDNGNILWFNNNTKTMVINDFSTPDDGNRWKITEAGDFDPTEALEIASHSLFAVTNRYIFNGEVIGSETHNMPWGARPPEPSSQWSNAYVTLTEPTNMPYQIVDETTIDYQVKWNGPFEFSTSMENAYWYNMTIRSDYFVGRQETEPYYPSEVDEETLLFDSNYFWAFGGNPYHVKVYNYTTGFDQTLTAVGEYALMRQGEFTWDLLPWLDGFVLRLPGTTYCCINQFGGTTGPLKFWDDQNSPKDNGSTFRIFEANPSDISELQGPEHHEYLDSGNYNLAGQRVGSQYKGIVIRNGKKVLKK